MPYTIRKVPGKNCYSVRRKGKGKGSSLRSKCTTLEKAKRQVRLLYALEQPGFRKSRRK